MSDVKSLISRLMRAKKSGNIETAFMLGAELDALQASCDHPEDMRAVTRLREEHVTPRRVFPKGLRLEWCGRCQKDLSPLPPKFLTVWERLLNA